MAILYPGGPPVKIRWFFADPQAKLAPQPNWFAPYVHDVPNDDLTPQIGDIHGTAVWSDAGNTLGYTGETHCGTEAQWANLGFDGATYPRVITDAQGVAPCCRTARMAGQGGVGVGGTGYPLQPYHGVLSARASTQSQPQTWPVKSVKSPQLQYAEFVQDMTEQLAVRSATEQEDEMSVTGDLKMSFGIAPSFGWLLCDGSQVPQVSYPGLYALIGTTFGVGAAGMFVLPDLRGRVVVGAGPGPGLTVRNPGDQGGAETVTLTDLQSGLPSHSHPPLSRNFFFDFTPAASGVTLPPGTNDAAADATTGLAGGTPAAQSHENMPPWACPGYWFIHT
jgi:microcystin-dependent protein